MDDELNSTALERWRAARSPVVTPAGDARDLRCAECGDELLEAKELDRGWCDECSFLAWQGKLTLRGTWLRTTMAQVE